MDVVVFYAWQSDRPGKVNRQLIRKAAEQACAHISDDSTNPYIVKLDSDTKGAPGMCDIPNTILRKIRKSHIFLADLTIVGKTDPVTLPGRPEPEEQKLLPNANVVFELGYAARKLGFDAMIGVMNEHYGEVEGQVFDIKRRSCMKYNAAPEHDKKQLEKITTTLSSELEKVIRATIETVVKPRLEGAEVNRKTKIDDRRAEVENRVLDGKFYGVKDRPAVLTTLFFNPIASPDFRRIESTIHSASRMPSVESDAVSWKGLAVAGVFNPSGYLLHASVKAILARKNFLKSMRQPNGQPLPDDGMITVQGLVSFIFRELLENLKLAIDLGVELPFDLGISFVGMDGVALHDEAHLSPSRPYSGDVLRLPLLRLTNPAQFADVAGLGALLKEPLDEFFRHFGWSFNPCYTSNGIFKIRLF